MADRLGLGPEIRQLKIGSTFSNNKHTAFHTLKYDFKPASVDVSKVATVDVGTNNTMTVTVPHLDGAGISHTVFKGSHKPYHKECVLIIDNTTGEITLEKLSSNVQVKKTRFETLKSQPLLSVPTSASGNGAIEKGKSPTNGRNTSRTKVTSGKKRDPTVQIHPKQSPSGSSSYRGKRSPHGMTNNIIPAVAPSSGHTTLGSLPIIGLDFDDDDVSAPAPVPHHSSRSQTSAPPRTSPPIGFDKKKLPIPELHGGVSLSESSSSSSSSDSDSDSQDESRETTKQNGYANDGATSPPLSLPHNLLNDDLQLSSESDSD